MKELKKPLQLFKIAFSGPKGGMPQCIHYVVEENHVIAHERAKYFVDDKNNFTNVFFYGTDYDRELNTIEVLASLPGRSSGKGVGHV